MLTLENLQEFIKKFQTNERNVMREYIQHLFLAELYKVKEAESLLFKGGTALHFIYQSPRFSEDIDFTGQPIASLGAIEDLFLKVLSELEKIGIEIGFREAKRTSGGYLGLIHYRLYDRGEDMKFEISLRKGKEIAGEVTTVVSDFVSPYTLIHLPAKELVTEKMAALLNRRKPRDYYDLYFFLRHPQLNRFVEKKMLNKVADALRAEEIDFGRELRVLLPVSHQIILKDFKRLLEREIRRYL